MNKSAPTAMADVASPALEKRIEQSIAKAVPVILAKFFSPGGVVSSQEPSNKNIDFSSPILVQTRKPRALPIVVNASSQQRRILSSLQSFSILQPRLSLSH